ncbi:MAG: FAD-binding oxidoreductase [Actinomycetota bacterium]|nr:FAD-binding oxidoreductase [Actinomycetota bacterium]
MTPPEGPHALSPPARRPDVVVIGAGIVGLASAYELARRKLSVCVLDAVEPGAGQSSRNWGFVRQQGRAIEELPIMIEASRTWRELPGRLGADLEWVQGGNLRLTDDPERVEDYHRWIDVARSCGLDSRVVTDDDVAKIVPGFWARFGLAIFTPSDGQVNPAKAVAAYSRALGTEQVEVFSGCPARAIVTSGGAVAGVQTDDWFVAASNVVLTAGAGSGALLRKLGLHMPVQLVNQTVALTEKVPWLTDACVWTGRVGFRQTASGQVLISAGGRGEVVVDPGALRSLLVPRQLRQALPMYWKNREYLQVRPREALARIARRDNDHHLGGSVRYEDVEEALAAMAECLPGRTWRAATAWAGTIDGTPDALPVIDKVGPGDGVVVATGMSGHGFGIAPAVGRIVADLVVTGKSHHELQPFRLARFAEGTAKPPHHLL